MSDEKPHLGGTPGNLEVAMDDFDRRIILTKNQRLMLLWLVWKVPVNCAMHMPMPDLVNAFPKRSGKILEDLQALQDYGFIKRSPPYYRPEVILPYRLGWVDSLNDRYPARTLYLSKNNKGTPGNLEIAMEKIFGGSDLTKTQKLLLLWQAWRVPTNVQGVFNFFGASPKLRRKALVNLEALSAAGMVELVTSALPAELSVILPESLGWRVSS
mgnify:FL=1